MISMSTNDRKRRRVEGHPGIYQRGGSFQVRHRHPGGGPVVSRSFRTLQDAITYQAETKFTKLEHAPGWTGRVETDALAEIDARALHARGEHTHRTFALLEDEINYRLQFNFWRDETVGRNPDPGWNVEEAIAELAQLLDERFQKIEERIDGLEAQR